MNDRKDEMVHERLGTSDSLPADDLLRQAIEALRDCEQWLRLMIEEGSIIEPKNENHIEASTVRARAVLTAYHKRGK